MSARYLSGFGNDFASEARAGALPVGRNSPQKPPFGLYPEKLSGNAFTAPHAHIRMRVRPHAGQARAPVGTSPPQPLHGRAAPASVWSRRTVPEAVPRPTGSTRATARVTPRTSTVSGGSAGAEVVESRGAGGAGAGSVQAGTASKTTSAPAWGVSGIGKRTSGPRGCSALASFSGLA